MNPPCRMLPNNVDLASRPWMTGRMVAGVLASLAELELELGRERRAAARQARRARRQAIGRPPATGSIHRGVLVVFGARNQDKARGFVMPKVAVALQPPEWPTINRCLPTSIRVLTLRL
jgi:hypothetical protein